MAKKDDRVRKMSGLNNMTKSTFVTRLHCGLTRQVSILRIRLRVNF